MKRIGAWLWNGEQKTEILIMRLCRRQCGKAVPYRACFLGSGRLRLPLSFPLETASEAQPPNILVRAGKA